MKKPSFEKKKLKIGLFDLHLPWEFSLIEKKQINVSKGGGGGVFNTSRMRTARSIARSQLPVTCDFVNHADRRVRTKSRRLMYKHIQYAGV